MIVLAGCGALGSQIGMLLAHLPYEFSLLDDERVEEANVRNGTSAYYRHHVGVMKAHALATMMYRKSWAIAVADTRTLEGPYRRHSHVDLLIDTFDNPRSRSWTCGLDIPVMHVGVSADRVGSVLWGGHYRPSEDGYQRGENPVCTHQLGASILRVTSAVAASLAEGFLSNGYMDDVVITDTLQVLW